MKKENSIILAVVSAHNDIANQIVLTKIKSVLLGGVGHRTLGIITKPDELPAGSEKEQEYLELARINPNKFRHGWHVLRNRTYHERDISFEERDRIEQKFFTESNWANLSRASVGLGIDSLREKLSKMLLAHIALSLPGIIDRLTEALKSCQTSLVKLGKPRISAKEMEAFLSKISEGFYEYTRDALEGTYRHRGFFADDSSTKSLNKRLRARIRTLNDEFAQKMLRNGHKWHIIEDGNIVLTAGRHPNAIHKSRFLEDHVNPLATQERGNELSGLSNPLLVGSLFRLQSEPWEAIASEYLVDVYDAVNEFLDMLLEYLTDEKTHGHLLSQVINPAMEERQSDCENKLKELLLPYQAYEPLNIDPHFTRKLRAPRDRGIVSGVLKALLEGERVDTKTVMSDSYIDRFVENMGRQASFKRDRYGALEIYECMQAFYEVSALRAGFFLTAY